MVETPRLFDKVVARRPDYYPWAREFVDRFWMGFWTPNEFNFRSDVHQFRTELTEEERGVVTRALALIAQVEIAVKTFWAKLGENLPHPGIGDLGFVMAQSEVVHNRAYEKLLDALQMWGVYEEILKDRFVAGRVKYLQKYAEKKFKGDEKKQFVYSLILFTLFVENVALFSQFYVLLWFNRYKGVLKDVAQQVEYTKNEETLHALVGIKLVNVLREEYPELFDEELRRKVMEEVKEAYQYECALVDWVLGSFVGNEKLSADVLKGFVAWRLNQSLKAIGYGQVFEVDEKVLEKSRWMQEEVFGVNFTDFFHKRPVDYVKKGKAFDVGEIFA